MLVGEKITMRVNIGLMAHSAIKIILIALLIGLGVNYGFFTPRGHYSLDYTGILGASTSTVVKITLVLYVTYRVALNIVRWIGAEKVVSILNQEHTKFQLGRIVLLELILVFLIISSIMLGIYWSQTNFQLGDLPFHISRWYSSAGILTSCMIIYLEKIDWGIIKVQSKD